MKTLEKMILCCIWICIAIVFVLIRDQMMINEKWLAAQQSKEEIEVPEIVLHQQVVLDETEVMELVSQRMPMMSGASLEFHKDGIVSVSLSVDDALIEQAQKMLNSEILSQLLPLLKNTEISCEASLNAESVELTGCRAGLLSVPEELLNAVEGKLNETWRSVVESEGIEHVEVNAQGLYITVNDE